MMKSILTTIVLTALSLSLSAQYGSIGFGFRAGLNYSKLNGPSESGPNGESLESYSMTNGFHIGAIVNYKFTDLVGLRAEFNYTQRGTQYEYNGPSYFELGKNTLQFITIYGTRKQTLDISNAFVDIPVTGYYKLGKFEIFGGVNSGVLVASTGGGSITINGKSPITGNDISQFTVNLNHNYKADDAGASSGEIQNVSVDGRNYGVPKTAGAYYDFATRDKNLFKTLDFGLIAGASYYLNENLFLSARYIHGLGDVDRNEYDISFQSLQSNGDYVHRADTNKSQSLQFSVGFSF